MRYRFLDDTCFYSPYFPLKIVWEGQTWASIAHIMHAKSFKTQAEYRIAISDIHAFVLRDLCGHDHLEFIPGAEQKKVDTYAIFELDRGNLICEDCLEHGLMLNGLNLTKQKQTDLEVYLAHENS